MSFDLDQDDKTCCDSKRYLEDVCVEIQRLKQVIVKLEREKLIAEEKLRIALEVLKSIHAQQGNNWVDYQDVIKEIEQVGK
jgi:hypothetical protein